MHRRHQPRLEEACVLRSVPRSAPHRLPSSFSSAAAASAAAATATRVWRGPAALAARTLRSGERGSGLSRGGDLPRLAALAAFAALAALAVWHPVRLAPPEVEHEAPHRCRGRARLARRRVEPLHLGRVRARVRVRVRFMVRVSVLGLG